MCQLNNMETLFTVTPWILKRLNVTHYYAFVYFWSHLLQTRYKKYPCKGSCKRNSYETICENIVSRYQTLVFSLPREAVFRRRRPKAHFMTGPHRQPSKKYFKIYLTYIFFQFSFTFWETESVKFFSLSDLLCESGVRLQPLLTLICFRYWLTVM